MRLQRSTRTVGHDRDCGLDSKKNGEPLKDFNQSSDTCFQKMLEGARMDVSRGDEQVSWQDSTVCSRLRSQTPLRDKSAIVSGEFPIPGSIQVQ